MSRPGRKPYRDKITAEEIRRLVDYDPQTGEMVWKQRSGPKEWNTKYAGKPVGALRPDGYTRTCINKVDYLVHRLAWLYHYGKWPDLDLDHRDRDRSNNRIENLREATVAENGQNVVARSHNTSGFIGVVRDKRDKRENPTWRATISVNGKKFRLGTFPTKEEASAAYWRAKSELHKFQPVVPSQKDCSQ